MYDLINQAMWNVAALPLAVLFAALPFVFLLDYLLTRGHK
jgi:hypothetical protein